MTKAKVLVLGSNGQLGSDLVEVLDREIELIKFTRRDFDAERDTIEKLPANVDYIINCISYHKTDECEDYPDKSFKVNSSFVYELAKFCQKNNITLFHISTDYVFDGAKENPYKEEDEPNPLNVYGLSKFAGEKAVQNYMDKFFIFRVSSLFGRVGASGKGGNFVETMIRLAKNGTPLKVVADQYMTPTHTLDIARAIRQFIINNIKDYGIYHCCNSGSCSWYEFTKKIFELANIYYPVSKTTYEEYKTKARRPKYSVLDNSKISKYYKMKKWEDALVEYLKIKGYVKA
ncbi:MAG: dTDP-4-dehydrorhamnose reductase [Candidatus Marinimicrobia bacterium]|nr:dTDP-4-dehydrorhamnose reductase [Candidatus Neomarinimicrobiota bacterium]